MNDDVRVLIRDVRAGVDMAYSEEDAAVIEPLFNACLELLDWADLLSRTVAQRPEIVTADVVWKIRNAFNGQQA